MKYLKSFNESVSKPLINKVVDEYDFENYYDEDKSSKQIIKDMVEDNKDWMPKSDVKKLTSLSDEECEELVSKCSMMI